MATSHNPKNTPHSWFSIREHFLKFQGRLGWWTMSIWKGIFHVKIPGAAGNIHQNNGCRPKVETSFGFHVFFLTEKWGWFFFFKVPGPGKSAGDLFGMVICEPFKCDVKWPPTGGWKGHGLNHLGHVNLSGVFSEKKVLSSIKWHKLLTWEKKQWMWEKSSWQNWHVTWLARPKRKPILMFIYF